MGVDDSRERVAPLEVVHVSGPPGVVSALRLGSRQTPLLPVRPRPYKSELLSSWLFRLAQANTQKLHSLTRMLVGDKQVWTRDIDRMADDGLLLALERVTGISVDDLRLHTLPGLTGRAYASFNANGVNRWILPLGIYHRTRNLCGLMYCPYCLVENPGFLLPWRLSLSVVCPEHEVVLLDACPQCSAPVIPHRVDMAKHLSKSLPARTNHTVCFQCGTPLRTAQARQASPEVVAWQRAVLNALEGDGMIEVPSVGLVPALEYLTVARLWLTLLTFGRRAERLRELVGFPVKFESSVRGRSFDNLDIATRLLAVEHFVRLLEGWPDRVVAWSQAARIRRSILLNDMPNPPAWYLEALRPLEYVNPRRPLDKGELSRLMQEREFESQTLAILQGYAEGRSVRQLAKEFGVSGGTVRYKVTELYQKRKKIE